MQRIFWIIAVAAAVACSTLSVDALSISQNNNNRLGAASSSRLGGITTTPFVQQHRTATTFSYSHSLQRDAQQLFMSRSSIDNNGIRNSILSSNIRGKVRSTITKISNKISSSRNATRHTSKRSSKRERFKQKFVTLAIAFSALFFISTGNSGQQQYSDSFAAGSAGRSASSSSSLVVARGGGGGGALSSSKPTSILNSIISRITIKSTTKSFNQSPMVSPVHRTIYTNWDHNHDHHVSDLRGGATKTKSAGTTAAVASVEELSKETTKTFKDALSDLNTYMKGPKSDTLFLLFATAMITPLCKMMGTSPILGFLASGMLLGPNGFGLINGLHTTETLAELGIVFFLFEMGIELSVERLKSMKKDVFGLGLSQYTLTALILGLCARTFGGLSGPASVVVGGALSLSSSAFVLQLIKDKKELATRFGKASFGVLLLQDLAVVPLLVATPILAGSGSLASALGSAFVKAAMALSGIALAGRFALNPMFKTVASANNQESFLGLVLLTAMGMSFLTEGLGLSNTLGAFLAGVLLSETKYRYQVEADIAPFRGILLGLFFVTVGFEIDLGLIANNLPVVSGIVAGILVLKAGILTLLSKAFGLSTSNAIRTGLILSQGGECK